MRQAPWYTVALGTLLAGCAAGGGTLTSVRDQAVATGAIGSASTAPAGPVAIAAQRKAQTVKVGLLLPLSGPGQATVIADTMKHAAELALADGKAPHVQLIVRDDKGTPEGAEGGARDLVSEGVEVILGPLFARSVQAAAPVARQAGLPLLAFSNDRQVAGGNVSLLSFMAEPEVTRIVAYAASQGKKRMAALVPADGYGRLVEAALKAAAVQYGVSIVAQQTFAPEEAKNAAIAVQALRDAVRGIEEHGDPVSALFLAGGEEAMAMLAPHLKQAAFDPKRMQVLGTGALDYAGAGREPFLVGAWFASPDPKGWADFQMRFGKVRGHAPPRIAVFAYDAMATVIALSNGPDGARYSAAQLGRASGFEGIDGTYRIGRDGVAERPLAVLEVQPSGARVIDAPPRMAAPTAMSPAAAAGGGVLSSIPSAFPPVN